LGTLIGIAVQEMGKGSPSSLPLGHVHSHHNHHHHHHHHSSSASAASPSASGLHAGLCGTSLRWGDTLLPFTAGTFLYVATVAVIPELLESGDSSARRSKAREFRKMGMQFAAMALGAAIMLV
jgi:zinc transporter ZupT